MLAHEAKACLYELHREHVEWFYGYTGWPSYPGHWEGLEQERYSLVGMDERPPNKEGIGVRYGITYSVARSQVHPTPSRDQQGEPNSNPSHFLNRLFELWAGGVYFAGWTASGGPMPGEIRGLLTRWNYAEEMKSELRAAFADFKDFKVGHGDGHTLTERLRKDEEGRAAIALTEERHRTLCSWIAALVAEPFGIDRDFCHLEQAADYGLNMALLLKADQLLFLHFPSMLWQTRVCVDTLGMDPYASWHQVIGLNDNDCQAALARWLPAYMDRVRLISDRWEGPDVTRYHDSLIATLRLWKMDPVIAGQAATMRIGPRENTAVESTRRELIRAIAALKGTYNDVVERKGTTKTWADLKSLALFHAFRYEAGEAAADITTENAARLAKGSGFCKPSSGKELKGHFDRYAWGKPEGRRRERTQDGKRPGDVLKRFDAVIAKLAPHAEALALAKEERKIVRSRSNANED